MRNVDMCCIWGYNEQEKAVRILSFRIRIRMRTYFTPPWEGRQNGGNNAERV